MCKGDLIFVFGPLWTGMAALLGEAGAILLSFLIRTFMRKNRKGK